MFRRREFADAYKHPGWITKTLEKMVIYKQREASSQRPLCWLLPQISSLQNCDKVNIYCSSHGLWVLGQPLHRNRLVA